MSERDTGLRHAVASDVTRDAFDENLTFGEADSSSAAKRWHSTVRSREGRRSSGTRSVTRCTQISPTRKLPNSGGEIIMSPPSPLYSLTGAAKIAVDTGVRRKRRTLLKSV
jgi:hypothetical protein